MLAIWSNVNLNLPLGYILLSSALTPFAYLMVLGGTSVVGLLLTLRLYQTSQRKETALMAK